MVHIYNRHLLIIWIALLLALTSSQNLPQTSPPPTSDNSMNADTVSVDAKIYAENLGVTVEEAENRFDLQELVGVLDNQLSQKEADTYAGLWQEHTPSYKIIIQFTENGEETLKPYLLGSKLAPEIEVRTARYTLRYLDEAQNKIIAVLTKTDLSFESDISVQENKVKLYVLDRQVLLQTLAQQKTVLDTSIDIVVVPAMGKPDAAIYGGLTINGCTNAFTVKKADGSRGIVTAGHCPDQQTYMGKLLPFKEELFGRTYDLQWHTAPDFIPINRIQWWANGETREITGMRWRIDQAVGNYVCKYGKTSKYTCGFILNKNYQVSYIPNTSNTFIRVDNTAGYRDLSQAGDSGGPWFIEHTAIGIHSGQPGEDVNDAIYMAIDYINGLNLTLITSYP